ncbi:MAG: alpha/beta hydrolase [Solirubrobacteraceae bacterium]|nr:alpha/beta hydrolase [Solirubrobacteraceae bacterium]
MTALHRPTDALTLPDGRRLGYAEWGSRSPDASTVLYFHGAMGSPMRRCAATDAALQTLGLRYVMVHRPGFGASDPQPGRRLGDWPDDVARLADTLGVDRFAVLGVSAGGPYAAACAHRLPDRVTAAAIVSGITPIAGAQDASGALRALARHPRAARRVLGTVVHAVRAQPRLLVAALTLRNGRADAAVLADDEARAIFVESFLAATERGVDPMIEDFLLAAGPWDFDPAEIRRPVHLWHGVNDTTVPVASAYALAATLPDCRAAFAPDEGHFFFRSRMLEILAPLVGASAGLAPHEPERRSVVRQRDDLAHGEPVPRVEGDVRLLGGLEVAGQSILVGQPQPGTEQR